MKCRACLNVVNLNSCLHLRKKLSVGKSTQEIIHFFIPEMVKSNLVDDYICGECVESVKLFVKFIEKIIKVETQLRESNANQKQPQIQILSDTFPKEPGGSTSVNKSLSEQKSPPMKQVQQPVLILTTFVKPLRTYPGKNVPLLLTAKSVGTLDPTAVSVANVQSKVRPLVTNIQNLIEETKKSTEKCQEIIDYANEFLNPMTGNSEATDSSILKKTLSSTSKDASAASRLKANLGNASEDIETIDLDDIPDFLNTNEENLVNQELTTKQLCLEDLLHSTDLIKTYDPSPSISDVNLNHNRVISFTKTNEEMADLVNKLSKSNVTIFKPDTLQQTETKRILLLGSTSFNCSECNIPYGSVQAMRSHFGIAHPTIPFPPSTPNNFTDVIAYSKLTEKLIKVCPVCDKRFRATRVLENHVRQAHEDHYLYECENCGKKFKKNSCLNMHLNNFKTYQNCNIRKCYVCKEMVARDGYKAHVDNHRTLRCSKCRLLFVSTESLNKHLLTHQKAPPKKYKMRTELCVTCGKIITGSNMNHHMQSHLPNRDFLCDKCPKSFKAKSCLRKHLKMVHLNTQYFQCPLCKGRTKCKESMKLHIRLKHSDVYTLTCHVCGSGFNREDYYKRHMKQHSLTSLDGIVDPSGARRTIYIKRNENDPFYSCKYCHREYETVHKLRLHLITSHLNRTRYKCRYCDMTFKSVQIRFKHEKRHQDPEKFELTCQVCWNRFSDKDKLEVHSWVHLGSLKYKCDVCGAGFPTKFLLNHHLGEVHFTKEQLEEQKNILLQDGLRDYKIIKEVAPDE